MRTKLPEDWIYCVTTNTYRHRDGRIVSNIRDCTTSTKAPRQTKTCSNCGAPKSNHVCDYCKS